MTVEELRAALCPMYPSKFAQYGAVSHGSPSGQGRPARRFSLQPSVLIETPLVPKGPYFHDYTSQKET